MSNFIIFSKLIKYLIVIVGGTVSSQFFIKNRLTSILTSFFALLSAYYLVDTLMKDDNKTYVLIFVLTAVLFLQIIFYWRRPLENFLEENDKNSEIETNDDKYPVISYADYIDEKHSYTYKFLIFPISLFLIVLPFLLSFIFANSLVIGVLLICWLFYVIFTLFLRGISLILKPIYMKKISNILAKIFTILIYTSIILSWIFLITVILLALNKQFQIIESIIIYLEYGDNISDFGSKITSLEEFNGKWRNIIIVFLTISTFLGVLIGFFYTKLGFIFYRINTIDDVFYYPIFRTILMDEDDDIGKIVGGGNPNVSYRI